MSIKNQPRIVYEEFTKEIEKAKVKIPNEEIIPFRDDRIHNTSREAYKIPIELLRFRKDNGRIASDVLTWENSKGPLDEATDFGQATIKRFLEQKDPEPTTELINSLSKDGQERKAVITVDGFLINGNRRKMALEKLLEKNPGNEKYKYLKVIILPGLRDNEPPTTLLDIEQLENRLQYQRTGIAEYYNFDKALSIKRKIDMGMSIEEQLLDDANFYNLSNSALKKEVKKIQENYLEPLKCVEKYLEYLKRPGHYNTVSEGKTDNEGRWQAFLDYYNSVYKKIKDEKYRIKLNIQDGDEGKIENIAFKIIRKRVLQGVDKKAHQIMRQFPRLLANPYAKKELFKLALNEYTLSEDEIFDEEGKEIDEKVKDIMWGNKFASEIIWPVKKAFDILEQNKDLDSPIDSFEWSSGKIESFQYGNI